MVESGQHELAHAPLDRVGVAAGELVQNMTAETLTRPHDGDEVRVLERGPRILAALALAAALAAALVLVPALAALALAAGALALGPANEPANEPRSSAERRSCVGRATASDSERQRESNMR